MTSWIQRAGQLGRNLFLLAVLPLVSGEGAAAESAHPIANRENCQLEPGLEISLFASEPDVVDPVSITFDEWGRAYVVEMRDYPLGIGPQHLPGGTVRLLEDRDGDGRVDRSTVFATGLSFPTSIAPWNGGVLVTAPPEIIFLKDTDGDGRADVREVLYKGFNLGVTDSNVNGLGWGLDNRVHGANGGNGGNIVSTRKPGPVVAVRNADFSFEPGSGDFAATFQTSGGFGLVFDDWGRSFVTYNINHIQFRALAQRYLERFSGLPPVETTVSISDHEEASRVYPISDPETRLNHPEQSGHFSSAGGMGILSGDYWPAALRGSVLVCDVVGNLVHRDLIAEDGPGFKASRAETDSRREFFASRDRAFRPTGLHQGPDGALYLVDMQRDVIEHPDYIPAKVKEKLDLRAGEDRGRIYRLKPSTGLPPRGVMPARATPGELTSMLSDANPWRRTTAQRLLVERGETAVAPALRRMAMGEAPALGRLHALWTLAGLRELGPEEVLKAVSDPEPGVRENALILAERFVRTNVALQAAVLNAVMDGSARVRFQAALTLGSFEHARAAAALLGLARTDAAHRWTRLAILCSTREAADRMLESLLADPGFTAKAEEGKVELVRELGALAGARLVGGDDPALSGLVARVAASGLEAAWRVAVLEGLQEGLGRAAGEVKASPRLAVALQAVAENAPSRLVAAAWQTARALGLRDFGQSTEVLERARRASLNDSAPLEKRAENVRLLGFGDFATTGGALVSLLEGAQPEVLQKAALEALRGHDEPALARTLLDHWRSLAPAVRTPVTNFLLQRKSFHGLLLDAIEGDRIRLGELNLDLEQRRALLRHSLPEVQARAARLMSDEEYGNRKGVVEEWLRKLPTEGDASRGRVVFERICAQCHTVGNLGNQVGPELTDVSHRSVEDLASNILDPNMAINPSFVSYSVTTDAGETETGVLRSESADGVTLVQPGGRKVTIPRKRIREIQSSGTSLMPEGLEAGMTPAELRDLIAFLHQKR